ncbi:MFS transporter [Streptomyces cellostaticus]|uniref:MFS transporter n=1 Tax=Streptomyces cellostaticus TaxID=67285 RepID=UPI000830C2A0|nr:MFS transporter [Streptomyces cellostaticus]GHI04293.1 MFS transporter [Streptomyces cellostaticus]
MRKNGLASLIPLYFIILIDNLSVSLIIPVLIPISYDADIGIMSSGGTSTRDLFYGVAIGSYSLAMFFGAPLLGSLSDHFRRKKTLVLCLLGLALGYALTITALLRRDVVLFVAGRVIGGLFSGSLPVAQAAILDVTPKERRVNSIGLIMFCVSSGYVVGPLIGGYLSDSTLVSWFDLKTPFVFVAGITLLNLLVLLVSYREEPAPGPTGRMAFPNPVKHLMESFAFPGVRVLSAALLLMSLGWTAFFQFIGLYLTANEGFDQRSVTNLISVVGVGLAASFLSLVPLSMKYLKPQVAAAGALAVMTVCIAGTALTGSKAVLYALCLVGAAAYGICYSGLVGMMSAAVDDSHQGSVMGTAGAIAAISAGLSGVVFGVIDGSSSLPIFSAAVFVLLAFLLFAVQRTGGSTGSNGESRQNADTTPAL